MKSNNWMRSHDIKLIRRVSLAIRLQLLPELQLDLAIAVYVGRLEDCLQLGFSPPDIHILNIFQE